MDFESRSRADLKKVGGRRYWDHPTSEAICAVLYSPASGEVASWAPGDPVPVLNVAVAHNAVMFDRFAAARSEWPVGKWLDSSHAARRAGLPGSLDALSQEWCGRGKDSDGNKFTVALSRPSRAKATKGLLPDLTPEVRARVLSYCANDVEVMADAWERLEPWFGVDAEAGDVDRKINDRGIYLDLDLVRATARLVEEKQRAAVEESASRLGLEPAHCKRQARSSKAFPEVTGLPNAQAETLAEYVRECEANGEEPHPLVSARRALASIIPGKLVAMVSRVSDDSRLRDSHVYMGAHTGRWSQKGVQLHNLTRVEVEGGGAMVRRLADAALTGRVPHRLLLEAFPEARKDLHSLLFAALIRACLCAPPGGTLAVLDYSGIEARATAWAAGDVAALDVFRAYDAGKGPDPYKVMAAKIFSRKADAIEKPQRQVGKSAELGCGYQMGADKFDATCAKQGTDLTAQGVSAEKVVKAWRELHHPIVRLWANLQKAFLAALEGRDAWAGPFMFAPIGDGVACVLPSGRLIVYRKASAKRETRTTKDGRKYETWAIKYFGQKNGTWTWVHAYGGLLLENAIQAMCRDLLADALVRLERDGLAPVLHVHDEAVCEVGLTEGAEALEYMRHVMSDAPDWARGLPIKLDGFHDPRYRK